MAKSKEKMQNNLDTALVHADLLKRDAESSDIPRRKRTELEGAIEYVGLLRRGEDIPGVRKRKPTKLEDAIAHARLVREKNEKLPEKFSGVSKEGALASVSKNAAPIKTLSEKDMKRVSARQKFAKFIVTTLVYLFLFAMALIVLFPFYWMIISSLKSLEEYQLPVPTLFPKVIMWSNYAKAFSEASLGRLFINTAFVGIVSTILSLIITVLSAFAFARLEFKGKNLLFAALLATMMIPGELFTITNYITISNLNWNDTYIVLIVPFLVSIFYIYLLKQNFMQIPNELYLAAKVDGTKDLKYLWKVMIPLSLPTLISITILKMMGAWNSYAWPNLVIESDEMQLITSGIRNAFTADGGTTTDYPVQMAAVTLVSIPLFLVFLFLRKYIMKGVSRSGIKG